MLCSGGCKIYTGWKRPVFNSAGLQDSILAFMNRPCTVAVHVATPKNGMPGYFSPKTNVFIREIFSRSVHRWRVVNHADSCEQTRSVHMWRVSRKSALLICVRSLYCGHNFSQESWVRHEFRPTVWQTRTSYPTRSPFSYLNGDRVPDWKEGVISDRRLFSSEVAHKYVHVCICLYKFNHILVF